MYTLLLYIFIWKSTLVHTCKYTCTHTHMLQARVYTHTYARHACTHTHTHTHTQTHHTHTGIHTQHCSHKRLNGQNMYELALIIIIYYFTPYYIMERSRLQVQGSNCTCTWFFSVFQKLLTHCVNFSVQLYIVLSREGM